MDSNIGEANQIDMKTKCLPNVAKRTFRILFCLVLYLVSSVPVGLFLYSLKSNMELNIFSKTGFHGYMSCLKKQADIINE